uniref:Uncharacterized protein n=1 Tax=Globodera rostochiensis TaxID=31243 RepID=A0A914H526_GLORO
MYKLCCSGNGEYQGGKVPKDLPLMIDLRFFYSVKMAVVFILMLLSSTTLKAQRNENDKFYDLMAAIGEHFGGELNKAEKALELDLNESELSIFDYWIEIIEMKTKNTQKPIFGVAIYSEKYDGFKSEGSKERAFKLSRENYKILKQLNDQKFSIYESLNLLKAAFNWAYSPTRRIDPELHFDSQDKEIQQEVQKDFEENCKKFENEEEKIMFLNNVHYELAINFEFNHRKGKEQQEHQHQHHQQAQLKQAKKVGDSRRRRRPGAWPTRAIGGMEQECEGSGVQRAKIQQGQVVQRGQAFVRTGQTGTGEAGQWGFSGVQLAEVHPGQNFLQHGQFRFGQAGIGGSGQTGGQGGGGFQLAGIQASQNFIHQFEVGPGEGGQHGVQLAPGVQLSHGIQHGQNFGHHRQHRPGGGGQWGFGGVQRTHIQHGQIFGYPFDVGQAWPVGGSQIALGVPMEHGVQMAHGGQHGQNFLHPIVVGQSEQVGGGQMAHGDQHGQNFNSGQPRPVEGRQMAHGVPMVLGVQMAHGVQHGQSEVGQAGPVGSGQHEVQMAHGV